MAGSKARAAGLLLWTAGLLAASLLTACGEPVASPEPVFLRVVGSTSMAALARELATAYAETAPLVDIEVVGLGTGFGLSELAAGRAELALASWLPEDLDSRWKATAIARDGIAVIVHPDNAVSGLGLLQLQDLFSGRVYEWGGVGTGRSTVQVQVVSREEGSGTRAAFESLVMVERPVTPMAVLAPSSRAVLDYVATHREAIGYVSMGSVTPGVKVLSIEGETPTPRSARQGSYPLTRGFWLVTAATPSAPVKAFQKFVLGAAGQQIVGETFGRVR